MMKALCLLRSLPVMNRHPEGCSIFTKTNAVAFKMTQSEEAAEDIVQEVFINIWKSRALVKVDHPSSYFSVYRKVSLLPEVGFEGNFYSPLRQCRHLKTLPMKWCGQ